jgi:hypothetical protein
MKKIISNCNRGLLVAFVAYTILVTYVLIEYRTFNNEKEKIYSQVGNYCSDILKSNINNSLSKKDLDKTKGIINDYWSYAETTLPYSSTKIVLESEISSFYNRKDSVINISNTDYSISQAKIKKIGPGYALFTGIVNLKITGASNSYYMGLDNFNFLDSDNFNPNNDLDSFTALFQSPSAPEGSYSGETVNGYSISKLQLTAQLHKEKGKWLFTAIDSTEMEKTFIPQESN